MRAALAAAVAAVLLDSEHGIGAVQQGSRTDAEVVVPPSKSLASLLLASAGLGSHGFVVTAPSYRHGRPRYQGFPARAHTRPQMASPLFKDEEDPGAGEAQRVADEARETRKERAAEDGTRDAAPRAETTQERAARERAELEAEEQRLHELRQPKTPSVAERFSDIWDDAGKAFLGRVTTVETGKAQPLLRQRTDAVFKQYDADSSGGIDADELAAATKQLGFQLSEEQIQRMLAEVDENDDGVISPEEFYTLILAQETPMERAQREQKEMAEEEERRRLMIELAAPKKSTLFGVELPDMKMPTPCISKLDCESPDQCCDFGALGLWCANPAKFFGYCPAVGGMPVAQLQPIPIPVENDRGPMGVPPPRGLPPPGPGRPPPGPGGFPM